MDSDYLTRRYAKPVVFLLCLWPALWLAAGVLALLSGANGSAPAAALGVNPVEKVQDTLGIWGLRLLLVTLAITPLRVLGGWPRLQLFRRMLGLFAFFYVALHFLWYLFVDQALDWRQLAGDVIERPYITAGFAALLLLVPLAATSTRRAMRRLGRRWQSLHRLVYVAAILGCVHYWWQVKADVREPLYYAGVLALLLGWRLWRQLRRPRRALSPAAGRARGEGDSRQHQQPAGHRAPIQRLAENPPGQG